MAVWQLDDELWFPNPRCGVTLRNAFFGESMFSLVPNASKLALIHLAKAMQRIGGSLIDCQFETPLFKSMGGRHISYDEYMKLLK
jgi:leucyl/phenylalanyl-tRNA--protein transferase